MNKVFEQLEFDKVLNLLSEFAVSQPAKKRCLSNFPINNIPNIKLNIKLTSQAKLIMDNGEVPPLENNTDILEFLNIAKKHLCLNADEIIEIAKIVRNSRLLKNFFDKKYDEYPELSALRKNLFANKEFEDYIFNIFETDLTIKDTASAELKRLKMSAKDIESNIKDTVKKLLNNSDFTSNLQDNIYTLRDERIVFQVKAEAKNKVQGIVHDISQTGTTFFIEPKELISVSNKLRETHILIKAEIEKILRNLTEKINEFSEEIRLSFDCLIEYDFIFAKAKYSIKTRAVQPDIIDSKKLCLSGMKNPVLMSVKENIVENNISIGDDYKILIITGSNTGGKTVALKTIGLFVLMAKAGMHVPCCEAKIYPFKDIFIDIGDEQNIIESLSTFSSRMKNVINIIHNTDSESLILLDEVASGTDPKEGASLAKAILEYFEKKGTLCVATTHYSELKTLPYINHNYQNACVDFDLDTLKPTYKLIIGIPGVSHAIEIAKNLGIEYSIVLSAQKEYEMQKDANSAIFDELKQTHFEMSKSAREASELKEKEEKILQEYNEKLEDLKNEKKKIISIFKKKYENKIHQAQSEIKEILEEIRKEKSEKIARRSLSRVSKIEKDVRENFETDEDSLENKFEPIDFTQIKLGDKAILKKHNQIVEILSKPDKKGFVQIQMGLLKTTVEANKLAKYSKNLHKKVQKNANQQYNNFSLQKTRISNTLDLRGYRLEEALDEIEKYLDKASLANLSPVYVIHGHGTGVLKQYIREYLTTSPYVKSFRAGEPPEGGDGVSVIEIK